MSSNKPLNFAQALRMKPRTVEPEVVDQSTTPVNQITTLVNQSTNEPAVLSPAPLVNQSTSQPINQLDENRFPSRRGRRLKGIRLPADKLEQYEDWQHTNRKVFKDFQDMVEYALDWLTSQPINQLSNLPVNQSTTLINNVNNQLVINDEKAKKVLGKYSELSKRTVHKRDIEAYREVEHLSAETMIIGLELTKQRADKSGSPFNSFRYALNCIKEIAANVPQPEAIEQMNSKDCPDCFGTGFTQEVRDGVAGARKCKHERLVK